MKFLNTIFNSLCIPDTAPVVASATVGLGAADNVIIITFDKAIDVYEVPDAEDFELTFSGGAVVISAVQITAGTNNPISITLDRAIEYEEAGVVAYTPGTTKLVGENGKYVVAFTEDVINHITQATGVEDWTNEPLTPYNTFDSSADVISEAINIGVKDAVATSNAFVGASGDEFEINVMMLVNSGVVPFVTIYDCEYATPNMGLSFDETFELSDGGDGVWYLDWVHYVIPEGASGYLAISISVSEATNFSVSDVTVNKL